MHTKKVIVWSIGGICLLVIVWFTAMFLYFLWVERYGDTTTKQNLYASYYGNFTATPGARVTNNTLEKEPAELIYDHSPIQGTADAPITIIAFIDFECPFCRQAYSTFQDIRDQYGPAVQIVFKHFPVTQLHPHAEQAHLASQCAHEQDKFWPYYERLFITENLKEAALYEHAQALGLNVEQFVACMSSNTYADQITQDFQDGLDAGVRGTPTYFINKTKIEGVTPKEQWDQLILEAFNSKDSSQ